MRKTIREQLREESPALFDALQRSGDIAEREWLPAIKEKRGSYNSLPHIRNLERHLDQIYWDVDQLPETIRTNVFQLNTFEKYIILASILMHDIGQASKFDENKTTHAETSEKTIGKHYAELGLPNQQIAQSIGRICHCHDPEKKIKVAWGALQETTISPFGLIREEPLATLLFLVDHLDSTFARVMPSYLDGHNADSSRLFRGHINGTRVDINNQMVLVSLNYDSTFENKKVDLSDCTYSICDGKDKELLSIPDLYVSMKVATGLKEIIDSLKGEWNKILLKKKLSRLYVLAEAKLIQIQWELLEHLCKYYRDNTKERTLIEKYPKSPIDENAQFDELGQYSNYKHAIDRIIELKIYIEKIESNIEKKNNRKNVFDKIYYDIINKFNTFLGPRISHIECKNVKNKPEYAIKIKEKLKLDGLCYEEGFKVDGWTSKKQPGNYTENTKKQWANPYFSLVNTANVFKEPGPQVHSCALPYYLVGRGLFYCNNLEKIKYGVGTGDEKQLPQYAMYLPLIFGDMRKNGLELEAVMGHLAALGLPLRAWLLEKNEHLYNCAGFETYEPILDKKYMDRVARAMNKLWCGTVDLKPITYEYLAAELRDPNLHRVRTAVRRIAIIGRRDGANNQDTGENNDANLSATIKYTVSGWSWAEDGVPLSDILKRIESLEEPTGHLKITPPINDKSNNPTLKYNEFIKLGEPLDQFFNKNCNWGFPKKDEDKGDRGGLKIPDLLNPGTGNIVIVGKAGTGKSTLAMQMAVEAVRKEQAPNNNIYAAYFTLEESRGHVLSKAEKYGWRAYFTPVNVNQEESSSPDAAELAKALGKALEGHCCRLGYSSTKTAKCNDKYKCDLGGFCEVPKKKRDGIRQVVLPKLLPYAFGDTPSTHGIDRLFHDRFLQIEAFLDAASRLRETDSDKDVRIVCIDSLNVLGRGGMTREHLAALFDLFKRHMMIGVFIMEDADRGVFAGESELDQKTIEFLADTVVELTQTEDAGYVVRHFQIKKSRYQGHVHGRHPFKIRQPNKDSLPKKTFSDKTYYGLHIFPSTHHMNAVSSNKLKSGESRDMPEIIQLWTDNKLEKLLISENKQYYNNKVVTIVGPATSGKSILAKNYLLQGLSMGNKYSLFIHFNTCCDEMDLKKYYIGDTPNKIRKIVNDDKQCAIIKNHLVLIDSGKYDLRVYKINKSENLFIHLALKSGFLLPEEFLQIICLIFECKEGKIGRVALYDVSSIGHSYPLLKSSSTNSDLFLTSLVQFFRLYGTSFMMVASRSGVPESEAIAAKAVSLADYVVESSHLDVFGARYIAFTGPGMARHELKKSPSPEFEPVPAVLRENEDGPYYMDYDVLSGFVGFSTGRIRRPGVSLYMFEEGEMHQNYNRQIQKMVHLALGGPEERRGLQEKDSYPDIDIITFNSKDSEAAHRSINLWDKHPLQRTVIQTVDEFAAHSDNKDSYLLFGCKDHEELENNIYYKNVLVLLTVGYKKTQVNKWEKLDKLSFGKSCYYDKKARESLIAGVLDSITKRNLSKKNDKDAVCLVKEKDDRITQFICALKFFAQASPFNQYVPKDNPSDINDEEYEKNINMLDDMIKKNKYIILCWYTQARALIKYAQQKDINTPFRIESLPNKGFRGDWYVAVNSNSVSLTLGKKIRNILVDDLAQKRRFMDGVGLPSWHRFHNSNFYFRKYIDPISHQPIYDVLKGKITLDSTDTNKLSNLLDALIKKSEGTDKINISLAKESLVNGSDLNLPAFRGSDQKLYDILNIHSGAKKRSKIGASGNSNTYEQVHGELFFILKDLVERIKYHKGNTDKIREDIESQLKSIITLCGFSKG